MILETGPQKEYELLDAGGGAKLERYGPYTLLRPDPEALWKKMLPESIWKDADLQFIRNGNKTKWIKKVGVPPSWNIEFGGLNFQIAPSSFKHTGLFPEQLLNWQWMQEVIEKNKKSYSKSVSVLNLFAYTGGATLACAKAGAEVCHVDGSKTAVAWARTNAELSGLKDAPIRWIVEDCVMFLKREIKRGHRYDAIIMDPPSFGHGPKDELWKIEAHFLELMELCKQILSDKPLFVLINGYTAGYSPIAYKNNLVDMMEGNIGTIEIGELVIKQTKSDKLLPCGIFARWERN
ncbi:MAG: class I SAM-dependent methyltransferase [Patescibacteria group bacterium]